MAQASVAQSSRWDKGEFSVLAAQQEIDSTPEATSITKQWDETGNQMIASRSVSIVLIILIGQTI